MNEWANSNSFLCLFRITTSKYADDFLDKGLIKFNTPQSWIDYAKEYGIGRGDPLEGSLAFCHYSKLEKLKELKEKYESKCILEHNSRLLHTELIDKKIFFKDKRSLMLPCFCLYIMKNNLFKCPDTIGNNEISGTVPASYFRDFSDNRTPEEVGLDEPENRPSLIIIHNFDVFKYRLYEALRKLGLEEHEIIFSDVSYFDFEKYGDEGWMDFGQTYPRELLIKNNRFKEQSEARVIIKTDKKDIIKRLNQSPIELGGMKDIAKVNKNYLYNGMSVKMIAEIELIK